MKKIIILFLILISFLNCKKSEIIPKKTESLSNKEVEIKLNDTTELKNEKSKSEISEIQNNEIYNDTLIPIQIQNEKSENIYQKYGLEFTGNCYACDLAEFKIEKNKISIHNVCDIENKMNLEIVKAEQSDKQIKIETKNCKFIFIKIHNEPIYKLKIINGTIEKKNLRISEYYTISKSLSKFEVHDCGDFQG